MEQIVNEEGLVFLERKSQKNRNMAIIRIEDELYVKRFKYKSFKQTV